MPDERSGMQQGRQGPGAKDGTAAGGSASQTDRKREDERRQPDAGGIDRGTASGEKGRRKGRETGRAAPGSDAESSRF
jgi:hypothetical protein